MKDKDIKTTPGLTELMNAADKILNQQGFIKDDPPKASDLWDIPSEAYDAAEQLLQEQETGGKKESENEPITAVEMLNLYDQMRRLNYDEPRILQEILSKYSITRKQV